MEIGYLLLQNDSSTTCEIYIHRQVNLSVIKMALERALSSTTTGTVYWDCHYFSTNVEEPRGLHSSERSQKAHNCTWSARHSGRPSARHGSPLTSPRSPQATSPASGTCNGSLWHSLAWLVHGSDYRCRSQLGHRTFSVPLPPSKKTTTKNTKKCI